MAKSKNLIINGSGSYSGGSYDKIIIRGEGTVTGDVECSLFKTYGTSEAVENVKVETMKVFGEGEVKGQFHAGELVVMGTMSIGGKALIKKLKVRGMLDAGERLYGENVDIKGSIAVEGDVEYDTFHSIGSFEIKGLLNAETIQIALRHSNSTAEEIGGGKISVKRKSALLPFFKDNGSLTAKVIEGDDIYLENTEAEVVRGNTVKIGPGCTIGSVEYVYHFSQSLDSTVKVKTKRA
ncbi:MAG: cytoplasmic protein [Bacillota bacterium]|nr:cytoplasmic protein [Bacillota bacterium]